MGQSAALPLCICWPAASLASQVQNKHCLFILVAQSDMALLAHPVHAPKAATRHSAARTPTNVFSKRNLSRYALPPVYLDIALVTHPTETSSVVAIEERLAPSPFASRIGGVVKMAPLLTLENSDTGLPKKQHEIRKTEREMEEKIEKKMRTQRGTEDPFARTQATRK